MKTMKLIDWSKISKSEQVKVLQRPAIFRNPELVQNVAEIIRQVRELGDQALFECTKKFDAVDLNVLQITDSKIASALQRVPPEFKQAVNEALRRIRLFHQAQKPPSISVETAKGVVCERRFFPIDRVGLYIPAGSAPLPSTLMMLAVPALIAGCREICVVTPPNSSGEVDVSILATAQLLGLQNIFMCGGAQAIAALAFGTESIPKVDKIFGPGNAWVTSAKMQVAFDPEGAAIDLPAGPSEVLVVADEFANPRFVAADLLSQAEHDPASQVVLISNSPAVIEKVQRELILQLEVLPRKSIAQQSLASSLAILVDDLATALEVSNLYGPEHLILQTENPRAFASQVKNAGSVFLGPWTPEAVGDYASGTNHVLPTYGFAKSFSGVSVDSFMKSISFQEMTRQGLQEISQTVQTLAMTEGLVGHARAVSVRLEDSVGAG